MAKRKHRVEELPDELSKGVTSLTERLGAKIAELPRRVAAMGDPIAEMYRRFAEENSG